MSPALALLTAATVFAAGIQAAQAGPVWRFPHKGAPYVVHVPDVSRATARSTSFKYGPGNKERRDGRRALSLNRIR